MHKYEVGDKVRLVKFVDSHAFGTVEDATNAYGMHIGKVGIVEAIYNRNGTLEVRFPEDTFDVVAEEVEPVND